MENGEVFLDKEESRHAFSVLRAPADETLRVTDGKGRVYECRTADRTEDGVRLRVVKSLTVEKTAPEARICVGLCDKDEFGGLVRDLAALGASAVVPLVCEHSQTPWWRNWDKHAPRFNNKMIAGIKQAQSAWLPKLSAPVPFSEALCAAEGCPVVAADENGAPPPSLAGVVRGASFVSCFVGPPGGLSQKERTALASGRASFVSLSGNRLRTELAAVVLCAFVKSTALWENGK